MVTFENTSSSVEQSFLLGDFFDVYVGLVSGMEKVYKNEQLGNIEVINGEDKIDKYIYIKKFPCDNDEINKYLSKYKEELMERKIKKFNENNWFQWGAPRNVETMQDDIGKECIYVYNLTRKNNVSFLGNVGYFGGGLIMLKPKQKCNLKNVVSYINTDEFKNNFIFSGRFKIGHRQLCYSYIPREYLL